MCPAVAGAAVRAALEAAPALAVLEAAAVRVGLVEALAVAAQLTPAVFGGRRGRPVAAGEPREVRAVGVAAPGAQVVLEVRQVAVAVVRALRVQKGQRPASG